ncbi:Rap guanine nucleotide exchange factor 2 [Amphibalanus amphitrite]|uniref:Rap guanine nucleotide exchange factor 2 n=1 Tax=Amphibalanus amphitrite TaxID=1232801 RepID=A0A6A4V6J1_AMPAM|nr:Rap guanine nucleotide exchange factor 2 [Amphibalanus amphitrite]
MFCPGSSFGKRIGQRVNDCVILEPAEMIVIDYPDSNLMYSGQRRSCTAANLERLLALEQEEVSIHSRLANMEDPQVLVNNMHLLSLYKNTGSRCSSDTSSAYSGSDTMQSLQSSIDPAEDVDLTGLIESTVDSDEDEEDLMATMDSINPRDAVRECLETDPANRTEDDVEILLEFTQHLRAFSNMTLSVRRALCSVMVFAVVQKAGTTVMQDGEELDSWSVIVNGQVEISGPGLPTTELGLGDSFGITPTMEKLYHRGVMRTKCDDCQFVCITQTDYYRILHQGEENTRRHEENGEVVLVTEHRILDAGSGKGHCVIKGTPERLMTQLMAENSLIDPYYVEDFLLIRRIFLPEATTLSNQLMEWFRDPEYRDRVTRVVLQWVNSHFIDFETDPAMMDFLERFEACLESNKMHGQLGLLNFECAAKSRVRVVTLARPNRDEPLPFCLLGGYERNFGIFVTKVEKGSKAEDIGLKRGDQILEVNGQSFEHISHPRALEVLRGTTHLSITVKSNLLAFKEMLQTPEDAIRPRQRKGSEISGLNNYQRPRLPGSNSAGTAAPTSENDPTQKDKKEAIHKTFATLGLRTIKFRKALIKAITHKTPLQAHHSDDTLVPGGGGGSAGDGPPTPGAMYHSHSNPDLSQLSYDEWKFDYPEHVLKVYKADQSCKYLLVHKETTAREVCMLSLREFGITDPSSNYSLCEVTAGAGGVVKQRRLPDQMQNLAERIGLGSRYYLKNNQVTEPLVPDELAAELPREGSVHFLQLNALEVAVQVTGAGLWKLTLDDFSLFRQIEATEYVDDLFELKSRYGTPGLRQFAELVNREMFWVITAVCGEHNVVKRMKIVKQFIKVARHCKECKNFNSLFNIVSGLSHGAVGRLKQTWDKLPTKYQKIYNDMLGLMDPSRNMSKYRNLITSEHVQPPLIPFYPIVKKDLTFIHLGNDTWVDGLVNFEKLRMIAKEVLWMPRLECALCPTCVRCSTTPAPCWELAGHSGLGQLTLTAQRNATVKRRRKSQAQSNPKKMFEEIPFYPIVKKDLTFIHLGNDTWVDGLVNFEKLRMIAKEVRSLSDMCSVQYDACSMLELAGHSGLGQLTLTAQRNATVKRRRKSQAQSNPKKMFEEAQMVRRVKAYLGNLSVVQDEEKLLQMSLECEPPPAGSSTTTTRRRHPSPTLSTTSSASSASAASDGRRGDRAKFGRSHERSQSDTLPVDLNPESSSVTSMPLRKSHNSVSSVSSSEAGAVGPGYPPHHYDPPRFDSPGPGGALAAAGDLFASPMRHYMYLPKQGPGESGLK